MVFTAEYADVMSLEDGTVLQTIPLARTHVVDPTTGVVCVGDSIVTVDYVGSGTEAVFEDEDGTPETASPSAGRKADVGSAPPAHRGPHRVSSPRANSARVCACAHARESRGRA